MRHPSFKGGRYNQKGFFLLVNIKSMQVGDDNIPLLHFIVPQATIRQKSIQHSF